MNTSFLFLPLLSIQVYIIFIIVVLLKNKGILLVLTMPATSNKPEPCPWETCTSSVYGITRLKIHVTLAHDHVVLCGNDTWRREKEFGLKYRKADKIDFIRATKLLEKLDSTSSAPSKKNLITSPSAKKSLTKSEMFQSKRKSPCNGTEGRRLTKPSKPLSGKARERDNIRISAALAKPPSSQTTYDPVKQFKAPPTPTYIAHRVARLHEDQDVERDEEPGWVMDEALYADYTAAVLLSKINR